jgi:DNA modification methylase
MDIAVEMWPTTRPIPYARNPRKISDQAVSSVAGSIKEFGFKSPIIVDKNDVIINGHTRLKAAQMLGLETVPVVVASDLTPAQVQAYRLADNRVAEFTEWDADMLKIELDECPVDLDFAGFDDLLKELPEPEAETMDEGDPDEVPAEAAGDPVSQRGEVYELGPHRLMCGDSTSAEDWHALMGGERASCAVTSPPYAEQREYDPSSGFLPVPPEEYSGWFLKILRNMMQHLTEDGNFLLNIKEGAKDGSRLLYVKRLVIDISDAGMVYKDELVWKKTGVPGKWNDRLRNDWEPIFHFSMSTKCFFDPMAEAHSSEQALKYVKGAKGSTFGGNIGASKVGTHTGLALPGNVIEVSTRACPDGIDHPAAYPVQIPSFLLNVFCAPGGVVLEPFGGSGTTLIAAAKTGRICRAMEIAPRYCDVIRRRWTKFAKENSAAVGSGGLE